MQPQDLRPARQGDGRLGRQLVGPFQAGQGVVVSLELDQHHRPVQVRRGVVRIELDGRIEVPQGGLVLPPVGQQSRPGAERGDVFRVGLDRLAQIGQLLIGVVGHRRAEHKGLAPKLGVVVAEPDDVVEGFGCSIQVAAGQEVQLGHGQ